MNALITTDVELAAARLNAGGLVGMPTETVYGLAADATNEQAIARLYAVKGRPTSHPVIVHLSEAASAQEWASSIPSWASALAEAFWPGPLTLVLPKATHVGTYLTGGQDTVALRVPGHRGALDLLRRFGGGVAAPSANRFGRVSPTSAPDVAADLGKWLDPAHDVILDGGPATVGLESTIVDATGVAPRILRPGAVSAASIHEVTGHRLAYADAGDAPAVSRAPGMLASHYAPQADVIVVEPDQAEAALAALMHPTRGGVANRAIGVLALQTHQVPPDVVRLAAPRDADEFAATLYSALRKADHLELTMVVVIPPPDIGIGIAIRDRLTRAATPRPHP